MYIYIYILVHSNLNSIIIIIIIIELHYNCGKKKTKEDIFLTKKTQQRLKTLGTFGDYVLAMDTVDGGYRVRAV